jgi:hypothetical protein
MKQMKVRYFMTAVLVVGVLVSLPDASAQYKLTPLQKRLLSGFVSHELDEQQARSQTATNLLAPFTNAPNFFSVRSSDPLAYFPAGSDECKETIGGNVKVNQNCLNLTDPNLQGRGQANNETSIAQDPKHPDHLVASDNDYRRGDGGCGAAYSLDGGDHWRDSIPPIGFTRGAAAFGVAREYWEASGDTSVAWDTRGNAYLACQTFDRGNGGLTNNPDLSSAVYVFRSTQNNGASWNFPARPVVEFNDAAGSGLVLEDKPLMTVDNHAGSPFQDRIYVTWTEFAADGSAYIWESHSDDYGETFSSRVLVSGNNTTLCTITFGLGTPQGNCNENQFSDPFTGSDGALYVAFNNFNNAVSGSDNRNQILLAKSIDGGVSFSLPVKVGDYYDLPDCATYQAGQDAGRACVPEKGSSMNSVFRATNYASGAVQPKHPSVVAVTFGSYINIHSNESNGCAPAGFAASGNNTFTGVKTAGACNNDILLSVSTNGGSSFTGTSTDPRMLPSVNQGKDVSDQWWQWAAFTRSGALAVSYYDRKYGNDETTGSNDVSMSSSFDGIHFKTVRATSSSMPSPTQFPDVQGNSVFFGDYTGLSAVNNIHPIWMDTRNQELFLCPGTGAPGVPPAVCTASEPNGLKANDQDIFTTTLEVVE